MNLPFVSRAMHRDVVEVLRAAIGYERENAQMLRRELVDLRGKYHQLKLSGAQEVAPPVTRDVPLVDEVTRAINLASRGDRAVRAAMFNQVARDRGNGLTEFQIIERINRGNSDDSLEAFAEGVG